MPDIIIHGATSFLGKHFIRRLLSSNIPVHVLARKTSDLSVIENNHLVNIHRYNNSADEIDKTDISVQSPVFFEFAWQGVFGSERNNEEQFTVNVPMTRSSIELAARVNAQHWIGIGSQAEYGNLNRRISEDDVCKPTTLYGKAKLECCEMSKEMCSKYGIQHSWLRLFSVYGPDDNHEWLIPHLIKEMLSGKEINVTKGEQLWDYLYVDDISEALLKLIDKGGVGVANLGSGRGIPVKTIIEKIKTLTHSESKINFGAVPYRDDQVMIMEADISRLSNHLQWMPKVTIDEGLKITIDFIKNHLKNN